MSKLSSIIDQEELTKFSNMKEMWWDTKGPVALLHAMSDLRIPFIVECLKENGKLNSKLGKSSTPLANFKLLDVGCGGGILTESLAQLGANITGVDENSDLIGLAKLHATENKNIKTNITYICCALEDLTDKYKNSFDVVVCSEFIENVSSKETVMKACVDVLKPGGSLFLTTMNRTALSWCYGALMFEEISDSNRSLQWDQFVSPEEVKTFLAKHNCNVMNVKGFDYFEKKWKWSNENVIYYALHSVKNV